MQKLTMITIVWEVGHPLIATEFDSIRHHVKNGKRGACQQKAATVLSDRTAAACCIYSSLSSFEFNIVGYGAPHDGKVPRVGCTL